MSTPRTVRLTDELEELLKLAAEETGKKEAQLIREALEETLSTRCKRCGGTGREP